MKKLTTLLLSLLFLCSCAKTIRPKRITEEAFPPEEAIPLVEALEEPFLTLPREGTITGAQLLAYKAVHGLCYRRKLDFYPRDTRCKRQKKPLGVFKHADMIRLDV